MPQPIDISTHAHLPMRITQNIIYIGDNAYSDDVVVAIGNTQINHMQLSQGWHTLAMTLPLAAVCFHISKELTLLNHFLPLLRVFDNAQRADFRARLNQLLQSSDIAVTYTTIHATHTAPLLMRALILGEILSCFWARQDVIDLLQSTKPRIALYANHRLYTEAGGVAGGCYEPHAHRMLLEVSRIFEGFYAQDPTVSPFLHEFGHMLDGTDMRQRKLPHCQGRLPLMHAQHLLQWQHAKQIEHQHYLAWYHQRASTDTHPPLGHPYVFQNDGEFLAGHWEMFWRNPHAMAHIAPHLFDAFKTYTNQDPRQMRTHDYLGYVNDNRAFYQRKQPLWPTDIRYDIH